MKNKNYWVIKPPIKKATITIDEQIVLENALIKRVIDKKSGTVLMCDTICGRELFKNGATESVEINGIRYFAGNMDFKGAKLVSTKAEVKYFEKSYTTEVMPYPPLGNAVILSYEKDGVELEISYEIYDTLPVVKKRLSVKNLKETSVILNKFRLEEFDIEKDIRPYLYLETNFTGGNMKYTPLSVHEKEEHIFVAYDEDFDYDLKPHERFDKLYVYELVHTAQNEEYKSIEIKKMYRTVMPWVLESPLQFHIKSDKKRKLKKTINMLSEIGFDMLIQTFGSGIKMERGCKGYIARHRSVYNYGRIKNIECGGYTLALIKNYKPIRDKSKNTMPGHEISRCLASEWSDGYWKRIERFNDGAQAQAIEIDGPYHFIQCTGGKTHHHKGVADSRYYQWAESTDHIMKKLHNKGIYINAPDWMYMSGTNKCGIGYVEIAFSEPRQAQFVSSRIYNYRGTFSKIPSMAWSFLPLDVYHGGGQKASYEPLDKNYKDYDWMLFQHFVSGVIPCLRGNTLFDTERTKRIIVRWTDFYKRYRNVINSGNTIHFLPPRINIEKPTRTRDIDAIFNVLPYGENRGVLALFNQTDDRIVKKIRVPMHLTGLVEFKEIPREILGARSCDVLTPTYNDEMPWLDEVVENNVNYKENSELWQSTALLTDKTVKFFKEEIQMIDCRLDEDGYAELDVDMQPMTYTYYIIKK